MCSHCDPTPLSATDGCPLRMAVRGQSGSMTKAARHYAWLCRSFSSRTLKGCPIVPASEAVSTPIIFPAGLILQHFWSQQFCRVGKACSFYSLSFMHSARIFPLSFSGNALEMCRGQINKPPANSPHFAMRFPRPSGFLLSRSIQCSDENTPKRSRPSSLPFQQAPATRAFLFGFCLF